MPVESPRQEASDSTDASDKEFSCPSCDRTFDTEYGVKQHHARTHGESIAYTTTECDYCGSKIEVEDCWMEKQEHHFCDRDCSSSWQEDRVGKECEICDKEFEVIASRSDTATCCSRECRVEKTRRITGEERYNYKTQTYECKECGKEVERSPSMIYSKDRVFCSDECFDRFRRNDYEQYYGRNWNEQRRKALKRDQYRCQACGKTPKELYREPDVHHIKPLNWFKDNYEEPKWWELGNRLSNLVVFCPPCHREWEGIPLRPI